MWTKRDLVKEAFAELGLASSEWDLKPEEIITACRRMDAMMAMWDAKGIQVGYAFTAEPNNTDPDQASGLQDFAVEPVVLNLANRLGPGFGKMLGPDSKANAKVGYDLLLRRAATPPEQKYSSTLPVGAGNKAWRSTQNPFYPPPVTDILPVDSGGDLDILEP